MNRDVHIGVTGTRSGMTPYQKEVVEEFFRVAVLVGGSSPPIVHHGDCVGVDVEFANIAAGFGCRIICHPPIDSKLRACHNSDEILPAKSYFARNRDIVDISSMLFVIPFQMEWQDNGGTWYTHDYAKKKRIFRYIVWPEPSDQQSFFSPYVGE